jgi:hypothetical protein
MVQDGMCLTRDFPEQVMSIQLKACNALNAFLLKPFTNSNFEQEKIFGYEQWWAATRRHKAVALLANRRVDKISALNTASQAAAASPQARNSELENQVGRLTRTVQQNDANQQIMISNQSLILAAVRQGRHQFNGIHGNDHGDGCACMGKQTCQSCPAGRTGTSSFPTA